MAEASLRPTASRRWRYRATKANARGRLFMRILSYSTQKSRIFLVISTLASVCAGATLPLMNILFARLVKTFNSQVSTSSQVTSASFMSVINEYVVYIVYLFIGRLILAYIAIFGFRLTSLSISASIRFHYLECLFRQPISTLDALPSGQTAAIITTTANILQLGISERLSSLIQAIAVIVVALTIGCIYSWELTLVTACGLLLIVCWYSILTPIIVKKQTTVQQAEREAMTVVGEALLGVRMIAACGAEGKTTARYTKLIERVESMSQNLSPLLAVQHAPVFFTMFATFALCFWYAVRLYVDLKFATVESLVVVLLSVMTMIAHLNAISVPLTAVSNAVSNAVDAAAIFFTIIDAPKPTTTGLQSSAIALDKDLDLRGIKFAYPSRHDVRVLQGFNLTIPAGKTTAIVGPSGSGKSTVVALISRWYELGGGDAVSHYLRNGLIKIGTHDLSTIDLHWWRAQIGLVQQDPFLFNDTIHRNVEHGLVGTVHEHASSEVKLRLVQQACKDAFADDFIKKLPEVLNPTCGIYYHSKGLQGYDTPVGEVGLKLSGGQRQRIAIARAVIRNPTILIFDEATSALDVISERIVQAALAKASQGRTTIVIAHRLSTIRNADQIAVVAKGRVVQVGNHDALLTDRDGAYWRLVNAQHLAASMTKPALEDFWEERSNRGDGVLAEKESYDTLVEQSPHILHDDGDKSISVEKISDTTGCEPESTKIGVTSHTPAEGRKKGILGGFSMLLIEQKQNWLKYFVILAAAAGAGSTSSIQAYLFARLISGFAYWGQQLIASTSFLCVMLVVVAVGVGVSYFTLGWVANNASTHTVSFYRKEYFRNIITKHISFFDDPDHSSGLLSARIATDPAQLQQLLGINMAMVIISLFNITGCITITIVFHWKLGLVVIASSLPIILLCGWYRFRHEVRFEARNNKVFAESARYATEAIRGIWTVASLTLERTVCHHYNSMLQVHVHRSWKEARVSCAAFALSDSMVLLCMAFSLWYGGSLLAAGTLQFFDFLVVYLAIIQGSLAAGQWLSFGPNIAQVSAAASRIHAMRTDDTETEAQIVAKHEESHRWTLPASLLWKGADIEFRDIHFRYPTRNIPVLRGCSLTILHGQFAAIVGSSGAGKTSLISLLERFYDPEAGTIFFNGEDIALTPASTLRKRMSLVAQEASIFHGRIRDNILFGVDDDRISETQLVTASRDAGIHDFVCSLPEGYNTDVGQSGVSLSGGQRQRIAIARALIRDPAVLLLDEATSSLDSETEREVQAVFERTDKGRTMVVVAHRLATVQHADVIFVMHEGRVVEKGDHKSLLAAKGRYWHMCEAQALNA